MIKWVIMTGFPIQARLGGSAIRVRPTEVQQDHDHEE